MIKKRKLLNRNIQLSGKIYDSKFEDHVDEPLYKAFDDNGEFAYCLPYHRHDIRCTYSPYELEIVAYSDLTEYDTYFTCSATNISLVMVNLEKLTSCLKCA